MSDDRRIKSRRPDRLTVDEIRTLARWCDNQAESLWNPCPGGELTLRQILACYHAANDADYYSLEDWWADQPDRAARAWNRIREASPRAPQDS